MHDVIRGKRPDDPKDFLAELVKQCPGARERCRRIFLAAIIDQPGYLRQVADFAFDQWIDGKPAP